MQEVESIEFTGVRQEMNQVTMNEKFRKVFKMIGRARGLYIYIKKKKQGSRGQNECVSWLIWWSLTRYAGQEFYFGEREVD